MQWLWRSASSPLEPLVAWFLEGAVPPFDELEGARNGFLMALFDFVLGQGVGFCPQGGHRLIGAKRYLNCVFARVVEKDVRAIGVAA